MGMHGTAMLQLHGAVLICTCAPDHEAHFSLTRLPLASTMYLPCVLSGMGGRAVVGASAPVLLLLLLLVLLLLPLVPVLLLLPLHFIHNRQYNTNRRHLRGFIFLSRTSAPRDSHARPDADEAQAARR